MRILMFVLAAGGCLLLFGLSVWHRPSPPPTPEALREQFYTKGPRVLLRELTRDEGKDWIFVLDQLSDGRENWLECTPFLVPGADADAAAALQEALARALPENPMAVLELDGRISLKNVCSLPLIEVEPEFLHDYGLRALSALDTVEAPHLQQSRRVCALRLREALEQTR